MGHPVYKYVRSLVILIEANSSWCFGPEIFIEAETKGVVFRLLVYVTGKTLLLPAGCHLFKLGAPCTIVVCLEITFILLFLVFMEKTRLGGYTYTYIILLYILCLSFSVNRLSNISAVEYEVCLRI